MNERARNSDQNLIPGWRLLALQQLGPGWFFMDELWTRGSILRHFRVNKSEKDDLEARILSGQFIFQVLIGVFDQMLNVSPFEKCFLTTNSNKVRTLSIRIFSEPLGLRKYSTRGYNKTHNKLQSRMFSPRCSQNSILCVLFLTFCLGYRPETKPLSFFLRSNPEKCENLCGWVVKETRRT